MLVYLVEITYIIIELFVIQGKDSMKDGRRKRKMDIYLARQPIFAGNHQLYGYELLYRCSEKNCFVETDDDQATAELIYNTFFILGLSNITEGHKAFINFSKKLINSNIPLLLPKDTVVLELLERDIVDLDTINACKKMQLQGYTIAADDFLLSDDTQVLLDVVDIVKIEFSTVTIEEQARLIKKYKPRVKFLAEKIETREEYQLALDLGYDYFQGYFFSKPSMLKSKDISAIDTNTLRIVEELNKDDPDFKVIADTIEGDLGLAYKLLQLTNSVHYGTRNRITTISRALTYLGTKELYQWFSMMMLKDFENIENIEMIKLSLIRGKLMELLAMEMHTPNANEYFFMGSFSLIDVLLNQPMKSIVKGLPLPDRVISALLGADNELTRMLNFVVANEKAEWSNAESQEIVHKIGGSTFLDLYIKAIKWANTLNY